MNYVYGFCTDIGIKKKVNQDSLCVKKAEVNGKQVMLALLCDGMGGLSKGELASATVIHAFSDWFSKELVKTGLSLPTIEKQWESLIVRCNQKLFEYGNENGIQLGTTLTAVLMMEGVNTLIAQVGDSRAYKLNQTITQVTEDQSYVAREMRRGNMTKEQAAVDPRRNVLLQCIGASRVVEPVFTYQEFVEGEGYLLCSDGFRHVVSDEEIFEAMKDAKISNSIDQSLRTLVNLNMSRGETDNITAVYVLS